MRIGVMLRALDEKGGIGVYTQNVLQELLDLDTRNRYVLFYRNPSHIGRFAGRSNVKECLVRAPHKTLWDQVAIPNACRREKVDVVFHPKFTAPLLAPCKAVMVVHGADWFIPEQAQFYSRLNVLSMRVAMSLYFRKCAVVISVSQLTTDNFRQVLPRALRNMETVYFGPARYFHRVEDPERLRHVKARYELPEKFILTLTKRGGDNRKNLGQVFKAYARYHQRSQAPHKLVVGGKDCHLFRDEYGLSNELHCGDVLFPGWIEQEDLPAVYTLADVYLYPSNLEAFPIPITEAMACGTPIITSNVNGLEEIAGDAALLVDPGDTDHIAQAIARVLTDPQLRKELSKRGLERSKVFSWDKCASETLSILERVTSNS